MRKLFSGILFAVLLIMQFNEAHAVDVYMFRDYDSKPWIQFLNTRKIIISSDDMVIENVNGSSNSIAFEELDHFKFYSSVIAGVERRQVDSAEVLFNGNVLTVNASSPINNVFVYSIGGTTCINDAPRSLEAQYSLAHLQKGIYLVKVVAAEGIKVTKILKN